MALSERASATWAGVTERWGHLAPLAGVVLLCVALAWLAVDLVAHRDRLAAWNAVRAQQGTAAYDSARSDRLYDAVYAARESLRRDATIVGLLLLALASCAPAARPRTPRTPSALRRLGATIADGALLAFLMSGLALATRAADRGGSEALAALLGRLTLLLPLALFALAARRQLAPSAWLAPPHGAHGSASTLVRTLVTLPAAAFTLVLAPLTMLLALRRPSLSAWLIAPHEALLAARDSSHSPAKSNAPVEKSAGDR